MLSDVFVGAYERSRQEYVAVKQNLVLPDIFRPRYRHALNDVVTTILQYDEAVTLATVNARLPTAVAAPAKAHSLNWYCKIFATLHPGNPVRFGLRHWVFAAWKQWHGGT